MKWSSRVPAQAVSVGRLVKVVLVRVYYSEFLDEILLKFGLAGWKSWKNKSCMRVDKREFTWEFHQLSCPGQTRTKVVCELTSESLHESFINCHILVKREKELHESCQACVCMRVSSTLMSWSDENKSCMRVHKREFTWEFHQASKSFTKHWVLILQRKINVRLTLATMMENVKQRA